MAYRILFVCMGNICRSPAAEGVLQHLVDERSLEQRLRIDSAGTTAHHAGERADSRMRQAAAARGLRLQSRSRPVAADDFERFDLIVAMDRDNLRDLEASRPPGSHAEVRLLSEFLPGGADQEGRIDVPDPYYGGERGFEIVLDMLEEAAPWLLDHALAAGDGAQPAAPP